MKKTFLEKLGPLDYRQVIDLKGSRGAGTGNIVALFVLSIRPKNIICALVCRYSFRELEDLL